MKKGGKKGKAFAVTTIILAVALSLFVTFGVATDWGKELDRLKPSASEIARD